jgi:hypothetical protein
LAQTTGLPNLLASYRKDGFFSSKANQRRAVEDVIDLALRAPQRARYWLIEMRERAFRRVRDIYQGRNDFSGEEVFKSVNKRYVAIAGGKYPAAGPATNSVKAMTLAQREAMRVRAGSEIGKDRHLTSLEFSAQTYAKQFSTKEIRKQLARALAVIDQYKSRFPNQSGAQLLASVQTLGQQDSAIFDRAVEARVRCQAALDIQGKGGGHDWHDPVEARAGNCGELAELVFLYLQLKHVPFVSVAHVSTTEDIAGHAGDHAFAIVGLRLCGMPDGFRHAYAKPAVLTPKQRGEITKAWVIDPWINEFCSVADYADVFRTKMTDWSRKGKQIKTKDGWIDPDPAITSWYAETVAQLNWKITDYHGFDTRASP